MSALRGSKAIVSDDSDPCSINGQVVPDEPANLPEGTAVRDEDEDEELDAAIEESLADFDAGRLVDEATVMAKLKGHWLRIEFHVLRARVRRSHPVQPVCNGFATLPP